MSIYGEVSGLQEQAHTQTPEARAIDDSRMWSGAKGERRLTLPKLVCALMIGVAERESTFYEAATTFLTSRPGPKTTKYMGVFVCIFSQGAPTHLLQAVACTSTVVLAVLGAEHHSPLPSQNPRVNRDSWVMAMATTRYLIFSVVRHSQCTKTMCEVARRKNASSEHSELLLSCCAGHHETFFFIISRWYWGVPPPCG